LNFFSKALDHGYRCYHALLQDPWLAPLRSHPRFRDVVNRAAALSREARTVFVDNGGEQLLGIKLAELPPLAEQ
jgi:hypothetical protein